MGGLKPGGGIPPGMPPGGMPGGICMGGRMPGAPMGGRAAPTRDSPEGGMPGGGPPPRPAICAWKADATWQVGLGVSLELVRSWHMWPGWGHAEMGHRAAEGEWTLDRQARRPRSGLYACCGPCGVQTAWRRQTMAVTLCVCEYPKGPLSTSASIWPGEYARWRAAAPEPGRPPCFESRTP